MELMEKCLLMSSKIEFQLSFDVTDSCFVFVFLLRLKMPLKQTNVKECCVYICKYVAFFVHFYFGCTLVFTLSSACLKQQEKRKDAENRKLLSLL